MSAIIYPTTNLKTGESLSITSADGIYVYDNTGKQYIEGMAGLWCTALGYNNQELIDTATSQLHKLSYSHLFGGKTHPVAEELADKLAAMVPVENAHVFFGNSGSDANDTHIKLLRYYFNAIGKPEKKKIIARERSYHGVTVAAACLTGLEVNHTFFDLPIDALGILRTDAPYYYRGKQGDESEAEFVDRIINNLEQLIIKEGPETIAAFIAEPITGASGLIVPPKGYYEKVQKLLQQYDILFWADEVITAFGRTGNAFGCQTMNIKSPDLMTVAKQLSSAYLPVSASIIRGDMYEAMVEPSNQVGVFGHGYTYSGHPVPAAVALKTLEIFERDNIFAKAADTGQYFQEKLRTFSKHPLVGEVRGHGLLAGIDLQNKLKQAPYPPQVSQHLITACQNEGLILRAVGGTVIAFCPPLIITKAQVDEMLDKFTRALDKTTLYVDSEPGL